MTVILKRMTDQEGIEKVLGSLPRESRFDAEKFCGFLVLKSVPLQIQKALRDEWE
ncbi:MAG: hypothetical protein KDC44_12465 [Phaeodactylibacter sp.]|nr:hypothetical protein [Phaeodactylibacter sp.]